MGFLDIFRISEIKKENEELNGKVQKLEAVLEETKVLSIVEINDYLADKEKEKSDIDNDIIKYKSQLDGIIREISNKRQELIDVEDEIELQECAIYEPRYDFATSLQYKEELDEVRQYQKDMIKDKSAVIYSENWTVDGSLAKGRKMTNGNIKVILRCFNSECEAAINKIKYNNIHTIEKRIQTSFNILNQAFKTAKVAITEDYLDLKFDELYLGYEFERKKAEEKEALREQREKEREEKALQKEVENKKKKINKEITHLQKLVKELNLRLAETKDENEKNDILSQLEAANQNIKEYTDEEKELDYRLENLGAGYVYIISNIGAFGKDIFKIGVTRRLDPLERINELSSASVPFKFDVHALIFSYNAYQLETELHNKFSKNRVNKVNNRKEFFKVSIDDLEKELMNYKDLTIEFTKTPDAEEYNESLKIK
jgi:gp19